MTSTKKESSAAVGAATDGKQNVSKYSSYLYDSTEKEFCQVMLAGICELADDIIADESTDAEVAGYAGEIKGRAYALKVALGV